MTATTKKVRGGGFLIRESLPEEIFIPEQWNEEQKMIARTCRDFLDTEVIPRLDEIDMMKDPCLMPLLLDKAGELGLLGAGLPEEYGGYGMDFNTTLLIAEMLGSGHSFVVSFSAHTGIGTLPILYFGTDNQKKKYLPDLASGKLKASYCLTEPDAGSDANAGRTRATLSGNKEFYLLNGQKMWITNGGFADLFIVFAKIDNDKNLSAFIVEKGFGGITMNPEEKKMGIKGSSTRHIYFNDCRVPVENLLGEKEKGFKLALDILNIGRIKLGASAVGGSKMALGKAIEYANIRKQFGRTIGSFGAIKHKLAEMASRIYSAESALYRTGQNIQDYYQVLMHDGLDDSRAKMLSVEEFAIECAMIKVHSSEVLDFVIDEAVQIHGGMGYSSEGPVERGYRDARINRIFEGTNEINRLLTIDMLLKRTLKGELDLITPAMEVQKEMTSIPDMHKEEDGTLFGKEKKVLNNLKKAGLMIAGAAVQKYMDKLKDEQELIMNLADMLIIGYAAESSILRVGKLISMRNEKECSAHIDMARIFLFRAVEKVHHAGIEAIYSMAEGDLQRMMLLGLKRFTKMEPFNIRDARRRVADFMLGRNKYPF